MRVEKEKQGIPPRTHLLRFNPIFIGKPCTMPVVNSIAIHPEFCSKVLLRYTCPEGYKKDVVVYSHKVSNYIKNSFTHEGVEVRIIS